MLSRQLSAAKSVPDEAATVDELRKVLDGQEWPAEVHSQVSDLSMLAQELQQALDAGDAAAAAAAAAKLHEGSSDPSMAMIRAAPVNRSGRCCVPSATAAKLDLLGQAPQQSH